MPLSNLRESVTKFNEKISAFTFKLKDRTKINKKPCVFTVIHMKKKKLNL